MLDEIKVLKKPSIRVNRQHSTNSNIGMDNLKEGSMKIRNTRKINI